MRVDLTVLFCSPIAESWGLHSRQAGAVGSTARAGGVSVPCLGVASLTCCGVVSLCFGGLSAMFFFWVRFRSCFAIVSIIFWQSLGDVLVVSWPCFGEVSVMFWCLHRVLVVSRSWSCVGGVSLGRNIL